MTFRLESPRCAVPIVTALELRALLGDVAFSLLLVIAELMLLSLVVQTIPFYNRHHVMAVCGADCNGWNVEHELFIKF